MNRLAAVLVPASMACAGCTQAGGPAGDASAANRTPRRVALDHIASGCRLPRSAFRLIDDSELLFSPPVDAPYESVDCALRKLRESDLFKDIPLGFVGNEAPAAIEDNAQAH